MPILPDEYGPEMTRLIRPGHLSPLGPGQPNRDAFAQLRKLTVESAFAHTVVADRMMAECCLSGLWLHHDFLDESHTLSQDIHTTAGSYWHGIMHRREGDFSNAKYWFRRADDAELSDQIGRFVLSQLPEEGDDIVAGLLIGTTWQPSRFVNTCQDAVQRDGSAGKSVERLSQLEWKGLFDLCYRMAINSNPSRR